MELAGVALWLMAPVDRVSGRNTGGYAMAQRVSRSLSRGAKTSRLSLRSQAVLLRRSLSGAASRSARFIAHCLAAVARGAHDLDRRRRAPGARYGGVLGCRGPWPPSPPPTRRPPPRPQALAAPRERLNVRAEALIGARAQT
jgi:hypothetical protein